EDGERKQKRFDMVVLSLGLKPPEDAKELSEKLGFELNEYGFCKTDAATPLDTTAPGVYVSGAFSGPKDIPMTVADASGAAARATSKISEARGTLVTEKIYPKEKNILNETPRIGVFVCKCGINIAASVDVPDVVEYAKTLPYVVHSEWNLYTCSQDTQENIAEMIEKHNLNRVIVASCTPRTHEPLFQSTIREAALNPHLFEMANIRDQCSWVHMHEPKKATQKSKELVRMAVSRVSFSEPLQRMELDVVQRGVVVGGGIAGMTAALELAGQGFETYLIEREATLGGMLKERAFLLDGNDPKKMLKDMVTKVEADANIHVMTGATIKNIDGFVGRFKTLVEVNGEETEIDHGATIIATGAKEYQPTEYLYGQDERVMTQTELETKLGQGTYQGKDMVMIQCVGSRNEERPYCSRVCCTVAIKNALKVKEKSPDTNIIILYKDIRTYGFKETFFREAADQGIMFIRYDDKNEPLVEKTGDGKLQVSMIDPILRRKIIMSPDSLVLSTGLLPQDGTDEMAQMLKLPTTKDGFFLEAHMKLRPVDFANEGVYISGMAHSPKFMDESISQASAAAARAITIISNKTLLSEAVVSEVDDNKCRGCGLCTYACPFAAIDLENGKAVVNEAICKGCGLCAATCRSGAIQQKGFNDHQIISMIKSSMYEVI
ncbi:MAG: FAD-dependent oxidoreductase, partial [Desulfobacterales bacterium]|nr:FAD-dependent oxidoreductase [Desulfobacterales bacterium]